MQHRSFFAKTVTWTLVFTSLAATTYAALRPDGGTATALAATAQQKQIAVVMPFEEAEANIVKRIAKRLQKRNLICTVSESQAAYLAERYQTETETLTVKGDPLTVFKIARTTPSSINTIRKYLRDTSNERCVVVPARDWYYTVLGGHVS
jgi:hypothetical protein